MKKIQSIFGTALMMSGLLALGACSNDDAFVPQFTDVPLQVEVAGVEGESRAIIEGTTLPNESSYGIFAFYGNSSDRLAQNIKVNYTNGASTLTQNVFLPENSDISVYAYYPYTANMTTEDYLQIESSSQIDYLYGYSANSDNQLTYVNEAQPKASIYFRHAMARVTLKVKKAADNENNYKLPYVGLINVKQYGYLDFKKNTVLDCSGTEKLIGKPENYVLDAVDSEILVDFLVLPMNTAEQPVTLCIGDKIGGTIEDWWLSASIPNSTWTSGQQYTYTVTISKGGVLELSEAVITEWMNNEQDDLIINEGNYAGEYDELKAVDLGLSVLWANWNIGASSKTDAGNYYSWGETETKSSYNPNNYSHTDWFNIAELDPDIIRGTIYDAATVNWGEPWRMPTDEEFEELLQCAHEYKEINGISGYQFTGENGNSIFLPMVGFYGYETLSESSHYYWSCDPAHLMRTSGSNYYVYSLPQALSLSKEDVYTCATGSIFIGCPIRPVCER